MIAERELNGGMKEFGVAAELWYRQGSGELGVPLVWCWVGGRVFLGLI